LLLLPEKEKECSDRFEFSWLLLCSCGDEKGALLLLLFEVLPKEPNGCVNRASSNSNFLSKLGGGEVEAPRFRLLFGTDDAEVLIVPFGEIPVSIPKLPMPLSTKSVPN